MTDKQIIIDYENLCENYSKVIGCYITFDGSCIKEQCFTYRLLQLLKAKEQEFEELKKNVEHWKMEHKEAKAKGEWTYDLVKKRLEQQLDKLKAENEILKEKLVISSNSDKKTLKIIQTLTEIKEIAENSCCLQPTSDCEEYENCKECSRTSDDETVKQILQKIKECEVEND